MSLTWVDGVAADTVPADDRGLNYADGAFEVEEQMLVEQVCKHLEIGDEEFSRIENWVRRLIALEKEALALM